jgi:RHS repeat-associated protein
MNLNQIRTEPETPVYDQGGTLTSLKVANGITANYNYDQNGRLTNLSYANNQSNTLKAYNLTYDGANNIVQKNEDIFRYDSLNQLILASMKGNFETNPDEKSPDVGRARDDFKGQRTFEFELAGIDITELDYAAGSIGVDLGAPFKITRLELQPNSPVHRVINKKSIRLYYSQDNTNFTRIADWKMMVKETGGIEITLNTSVTARYFKVKSMHDERNFEFAATNQAEFINGPQDLIHVYYLLPSRQEEFSYDAIGNRTRETITQRAPVVRNYTYYSNSSRLKSNEKYTFEYDANGNLIKKETLIGEKIVWKYEYDLFNRLVKVKKNDSVVAEYMYDEAGLRIKKTSPDSAIYYVFDAGGNVLYEQENREYMEYVYVLGKHFARIDGNLDNGIGKKYFYHTDHLGSTVLVTDQAGQQVWSAEYTPFGKQVSKDGELDHVTKFTGKALDEDTGLYYYNARWYDQEVGRFVSEDTVSIDPNDPFTLNFYTYGNNNPLRFTDPTGNTVEDETNNRPATTPTPPQNATVFRPQPGPGPDAPRDPNRDNFNIPLTRQLASIGIGFIPYVGDAKDWQEVVTGRDYVSGDRLSTRDQVFTALAAAVPIIGGKVVREIAGKVADEGLELAEQLVKGSDNLTREITQYSGDLIRVNKADVAADALVNRIGGQSRVRFSNDLSKREFDVVSDQYIGQTKQALQSVGSSFRDQAKATFEAAKQTGKSVYYHFEGKPAQEVVNKLNEYAKRYNVKLVIDTKPLK